MNIQVYFTLEGLLGLGPKLPALGALLFVPLGLFWLFSGKLHFPSFAAAVAALVGFELGVRLGVPWAPWLFALTLGVLAWPLYSLGAFVSAGVFTAFIAAEAITLGTGLRQLYLWFAAGGFLVGGFVGLSLIEPASIFVTAAGGAFLLFTGAIAALGAGWPGAAAIPAEYPLLCAGAVALLALVGVFFQWGLPSPGDKEAARVQALADRLKAEREFDEKRRWREYLDSE